MGYVTVLATLCIKGLTREAAVSDTYVSRRPASVACFWSEFYVSVGSAKEVAHLLPTADRNQQQNVTDTTLTNRMHRQLTVPVSR